MAASPPYLLALDQGTTSSRAILFSRDARQLAAAQQEFPQLYPQPGHVEHDPATIWQSQLDTARRVIADAKIAPSDIAAIGITNQRETTLLWDRSTGTPLHNAIVWQDRRTADLCNRLKISHAKFIQERTGLIPDAYFSASKLQWLLDNIPHARERAAKGELAFGTVDTWLLYNLTARQVHATDISNASRTMLFNIHTCKWDDEMLSLFNIPREILPTVHDSASHFGSTGLLGHTIPITGIAGDQQAALFGQSCLRPGLAKNTYGTGCFMLMNTGTQAPTSKHNLLTTIAWRLPSQINPSAESLGTHPQNAHPAIENRKSKIEISSPPPTYALEGSVFIGGAVVQWLRDGLGIIQSTADIEPLARSVPDSGGVFLVPAFTGLGAPHWDPYARGTIVGITRGTTKAHFARAALESIAFQVADLLDIMRSDSGSPITALRVDGGGSRNNLLLQFQADLLQIPVVRPLITETTALGAALLAGLGAAVYKTTAELENLGSIDATFHPNMAAQKVGEIRARWNSALQRAANWEPSDI
jgi:glycerol kinase